MRVNAHLDSFSCECGRPEQNRRPLRVRCSAIRPAHAPFAFLITRSIETSGAKRTTCANSSSLTLDSCSFFRSAYSSLQFFASLLRSSDSTWSLADLDPSRCGAATLSVPLLLGNSDSVSISSGWKMHWVNHFCSPEPNRRELEETVAAVSRLTRTRQKLFPQCTREVSHELV